MKNKILNNSLVEQLPDENFETKKSIDLKFIKSLNSKVVLLPDNDVLSNVSNKNNFMPFTKDLLLKMQENKINTSLYDDGTDKRIIALHSADLTHFQYLVIPTIVFLDKVVIPIALSILSAWIYDRWLKKGDEPPMLKVEYARFDGEKIIDWQKIQGSAEDVHKILLNDANTFNVKNQIDKTEIKEDLDDLSSEDAHTKLAEDSLAAAKYLIKKGEFALKRNKMKEAESLFRRSLFKIREASLWKPDERFYKEYLYEMGIRIHDTFKCIIKFNKENNKYHVNCPVRLSNFKGGFSPGMSVKTICSICGKNSLDCSHSQGIYAGVIAKKIGGVCNICRKEECNHIIGNKYDNVKAVNIATDIEMDHIALVDNPLDPRCVIMSYEITPEEMLNSLPDNEKEKVIYGNPIYCNYCVI